MEKLLLITCLLTGTGLFAQDIHFSQYYNTPLINNPAFTGIFGGDHRAMLVYRNQWMTVASPYTTYGFAYDTRMMEKRGNFSLGTGLGVYRDVAGDTKMGITNVSLSLNGIIKLNSTQHLSLGVNGGFEQRSINNSSLIWDKQYDQDAPEYYNSTASSGETSDYNGGFNAGDINAGLAWVYSKSTRKLVNDENFSLKIGAVYQHITSQELKYGETPDQLWGKLSFQVESNVTVNNSSLSFQPNLLYQRQGPNQEILIGTLIRNKLGFDSRYTGMLRSSAFLIGLHIRLGDAIIPSIGYEIPNWKIFFSYDANVSKLRTASNSIGGFEVSLIFVSPGKYIAGKGHSARFN